MKHPFALLALALALFHSPLSRADFGKFKVPACAYSDVSSDQCVYWYTARGDRGPAVIQNPKTDNLVIYFAGGDQLCAAGLLAFTNEIYGGVAAAYTKENFLFVCANLFETPGSSGAAAMPYYKEKNRFLSLVSHVLTNPEIRKRWNGNRLLYSGISHGATAPVLAMRDTQPVFMKLLSGRKTTAACFLDGQYDVFYNQQFWLTPENRKQCQSFVDRTICNRYFGKEGCSVPAFDREMANDSLVSVAQDRLLFNPSQLAIQNWKLVECGSRLPACEGHQVDMLPAPPIKKLCEKIEASPQHQCEFESHAAKSHVECGIEPVASGSCLKWFLKQK